jgi:alginate biosynthesis protein AlgX
MSIGDNRVERGGLLSPKTKVFCRVVGGALFFLLLCISAPHAETTDGAMGYGFKTYFRHHPPRERIPAQNLYPFPGPVIGAGQDIPVCDAARADVIHGQKGWLFRPADFRMDFAATSATIGYFDRLRRTLAAKGQALVVVLPPPRGMAAFSHVDPAAMPNGYSADEARKKYRGFIDQIRKAGIAAADLSEAPANYYSSGDFHWTPEGAAWTAAAVAQEVKKLPAYGGLRKQKFKTAVAGLAPPRRGALEEAVQHACGVNIRMTAGPVLTTVAENSAKGGNAAFAGIALLGTGNAAEDERYGFAGALKRALSAEIYNAAAATGDATLAPYGYFSSDAYRRHPPKIIIWELAAGHNYNNPASHAAFRQMLSAIDGGCSDKAALARWSGNLEASETNIFEGLEKTPLAGKYLYLEASGVSPESLRAEILYGDGAADEINMAASPPAAGTRRYYLSLGDTTAAPARYFHVLSEKPGGSLTARLCPASIHLAGG